MIGYEWKTWDGKSDTPPMQTFAIRKYWWQFWRVKIGKPKTTGVFLVEPKTAAPNKKDKV